MIHIISTLYYFFEVDCSLSTAYSPCIECGIQFAEQWFLFITGIDRGSNQQNEREDDTSHFFYWNRYNLFHFVISILKFFCFVLFYIVCIFATITQF